jgi:3-deoxy-7-phosphoheptulonate synthase/chorismate mutase
MNTATAQQINEQLSELDARLLRLLEDRAALLQQAESSVQEAALRRIKQVQAAVAAQAAAPKKPLLVSRKSKQTDTVIALGETEIGGGKPLMIAGPCSVESREQVREVAAALKQAGITVMRGGAFKPRTSLTNSRASAWRA